MTDDPDFDLVRANLDATDALLDAIARAAEQQGITHARLASEIGCTPEHVTDALAGHLEITMSDLRMLAAGAGVLISITTSVPDPIRVVTGHRITEPDIDW